jgi:hypothetical protein
MISFISPCNTQQSNTGMLIHLHITVYAAVDVTGYNNPAPAENAAFWCFERDQI